MRVARPVARRRRDHPARVGPRPRPRLGRGLLAGQGEDLHRARPDPRLRAEHAGLAGRGRRQHYRRRRPRSPTRSTDVPADWPAVLKLPAQPGQRRPGRSRPPRRSGGRTRRADHGRRLVRAARAPAGGGRHRAWPRLGLRPAGHDPGERRSPRVNTFAPAPDHVDHRRPGPRPADRRAGRAPGPPRPACTSSAWPRAGRGSRPRCGPAVCDDVHLVERLDEAVALAAKTQRRRTRSCCCRRPHRATTSSATSRPRPPPIATSSPRCRSRLCARVVGDSAPMAEDWPTIWAQSWDLEPTRRAAAPGR